MIKIKLILLLIAITALCGCQGCHPDLKWGTLANPGFRQHRIKSTLFFSGQARDGSNPYGCNPTNNMPLYTVHPVDERHLNWSTDPVNRQLVIDEMVQAGINVVSMSSWDVSSGQCDGYWFLYAPMQTSPASHDELFEAVGNSLLIMPFIESHTYWNFRDEFPRTEDGQVAPGAVNQIVDLIERYLHNPEHPEWAERWARVYDREGEPRYAVVIIHVASKRLEPDKHPHFAHGFDTLAEEVFRETGTLVGFFIDVLPPVTSSEFRASPEETGPFLYKRTSILGIQCFIPEIGLGGSNDDERIERKRDFSRRWAETEIPFIMDISPGYNAYIVFPNSPYYGFTNIWVNELTDMVNDFADGLVYNSWNGYTEGMAAVPTHEHGDVFYEWLQSFDLGIGPPYYPIQ